MNTIKLTINNINFNFFEDENETEISKLIRHLTTIHIIRYNPTDNNAKNDKSININSSTISINKKKLDRIVITSSSGISTLPISMLELSDLDKTPLIIECFTISKSDEYYNIKINNSKLRFSLSLENIDNDSELSIDNTCWFEPSLRYQEESLFNRDAKINKQGYVLLEDNDQIKLFDIDTIDAPDKAVANTLNWQKLNYVHTVTYRSPSLITSIDMLITLNKKDIDKLIKLFKDSGVEQVETELGTLQYINGIISLTYKNKEHFLNNNS